MVLFFFLSFLADIKIPEKIDGWIKKDYKRYDRESIFEYLNGSGEIYISYGFLNLYSFLYKKNKNELILDIFKMEKPNYSLGLFTHFKGNGEKILNLGKEAEFFGNNLFFWKGKYFVSILTKLKEKREDLISFARIIEKNLEEEEPNLEILKFANNLGIDLEKIKYFFKMDILNLNYYLINEDIFNFNGGTEAIFSPFKEGFVLILMFKNEDEAKKGLKNLKEKFYKRDSELMEIEKGKWSSYLLKGKFLIIFFDYPGKENLLKILYGIR